MSRSFCLRSLPKISASQNLREMVLSNKKLKQKFRSLLAESVAVTESKKSHKDSLQPADVNEELQSIKEILISKSRKKPKSPNSKKRRRPLGKNPTDSEGSEETQKGNGESAVKEEEEKKTKKKKGKVKKEEGKGEIEKESESEKRKIVDDSDRRLNEEEKKKKKEKKKKQKEKKVKVKEGNNEKEGGNIEKANESVETESNEKRVVEEPIKINQSETKKLYVGGIPYYSSEDDIRSFFEGCGTVTEVDCMTFPESGKFRGIAILTFKTEAAAKRALALDGADMGGFFLKIQPYKAKQSSQKPEFAPKIVEGYNRVYVGNLSWDITEDDLKQLFSDCKVSSIRFGTDKETGDFKGYAHVDFVDTVSLTIALKLDQKVVCGRPVRISCAVPPKKGANINAKEKPAAKKGENDETDGSSKRVENNGTSGNSKKKRRTCYVCGVPGHLSSACPRKKAADGDDSGVKS